MSTQVVLSIDGSIGICVQCFEPIWDGDSWAKTSDGRKTHLKCQCKECHLPHAECSCGEPMRCGQCGSDNDVADFWLKKDHYMMCAECRRKTFSFAVLTPRQMSQHHVKPSEHKHG